MAGTAAKGLVARSLAEAYKFRNSATQLLMPGHADLLCMNMLCEKAGQACACRLALSLSRMPQLQHVDISSNAFTVLPDSLAQLQHVHTLDVSNNQLTSVPGDILTGMASLALLHVAGNPLGDAAMADIAQHCAAAGVEVRM